MWKIPFSNHFIKLCCMKVFCTYCFGCLISAFFRVSPFSRSFCSAFLICLPTCACLFLYRFASLDLGSFKSSNWLVHSILPKVDWLKLLTILVLCGGESQKPGTFKERTTYTLPYFHKKRYNLSETLSSWTTVIRYNLAIRARNKPH